MGENMHNTTTLLWVSNSLIVTASLQSKEGQFWINYSHFKNEALLLFPFSAVNYTIRVLFLIYFSTADDLNVNS